MALYLIGDVQGCNRALGDLLQEIDFSPSRDQLVLLGDLVNRGPDSLGVLRRMMALEGAAQCLLGNHDLHLLAQAQGKRRPSRKDTLEEVMNAPDRPAIVQWLRRRPLALEMHNTLMVHAGVLPQWSASETLALAAEVECELRSARWEDLLASMYGNAPAQWSEQLRSHERWRVIINALTRLRYCTPEGVMDFEIKDGAADAPPGLLAWFDAPGRRTEQCVIAFGHWSTLGYISRDNLLGLDTGCVWGGRLTAVRLGQRPQDRERFSIKCKQEQKPG